MYSICSLSMIPPKRFDIFPLTGGCSEGLEDTSRFFFKLQLQLPVRTESEVPVPVVPVPVAFFSFLFRFLLSLVYS